MFLGIYFVLLPEFDFATLASNTCKIFVQLSPMQLMLFHTNELLNELISYEIYDLSYEIYRKIPKISPGAYIFQRPFLRGLFFEGLIFGRAYPWSEICVSKSIGLAL